MVEAAVFFLSLARSALSVFMLNRLTPFGQEWTLLVCFAVAGGPIVQFDLRSS